MRGSPVRKTSSGILRLVAKLLPGSVVRPLPRAILNSSSPVGAASMMKPRSAPLTSIAESSTSDSTSSSTRPEPSARSPSSSAAICRRSPIAVVVARSTGGGESARRKTISAPPRAAETDAIAVREGPLGDLLAVDVGAVARVAVAEHEMVVLERDLGVVARHLAAGQPQIVGLAAADLELRLGDRDDAPSERVGHFEAGVGHGESLMEDLRIAKTAQRRRIRTSRTASAAAGADSGGELVDFGVGRGP